MIKIDEEIVSIGEDLKAVKETVEIQSRSSWEMKQVIDNIKIKLESFFKTFENIEMPSPDFG